MPDEPQAAPPDAPIIRRLTIERFRGIEALTWHPGPGVNVILGGGDVGKTTLLEAIALLLSPTNAGTISDTDYYRRGVGAGFAIEVVVSLPSDSGINDQVRASWPWQWDGVDAVVPAAEGQGEDGEPVYKLRVRATADLELAFEVLQPDGSADPLSVALRCSIGLDVSLPLTMWGAGTRRLSALAITAFNQRSVPVTIVDEVERGLEPYRQRRLIGKLQDGSGQVFLTTHGPSTIAAAATSRF